MEESDEDDLGNCSFWPRIRVVSSAPGDNPGTSVFGARHVSLGSIIVNTIQGLYKLGPQQMMRTCVSYRFVRYFSRRLDRSKSQPNLYAAATVLRHDPEWRIRFTPVVEKVNFTYEVHLRDEALDDFEEFVARSIVASSFPVVKPRQAASHYLRESVDDFYTHDWAVDSSDDE